MGIFLFIVVQPRVAKASMNNKLNLVKLKNLSDQISLALDP